mgnify:FL=1
MKEIITNLLKNPKIRKIFIIIVSSIPVIFILIPSVYMRLNFLFYDIYFRNFKKDIKQSEDLVLVDIDDNSMNMEYIPYSWPWPRYIHGDALEIIADFGARAVIYDIEFLGNSVAGVNIEEAKELNNLLSEKFQNIYEEFDAQSDFIVKNRIYDLEPVKKSFNKSLINHYQSITTKMDKVFIDNDIYFAKRIRYYGKAYGTVNMLYDKHYKDDLIDKNIAEYNNKMLEKFGIKRDILLKNRKSHGSIIEANITEFPNSNILNEFKNVGFTKVERDKDASVRGINLFMKKNDFIIPQLAFRPFLDIYNITAEKIDLSKNNLVILRDVEIEGKKRDIKIPIYENKMIINWPKGEFNEIFISNKEEVKNKKEPPTHFAYYYLLYYKYEILKNFENSLENLSKIEEKEAMDLYNEYIEYRNAKNELIETTILTDELRKEINDYFEDYINRVLNFVTEENIRKREKEIDDFINSNKINSNKKEEFENIKRNIRAIFENTRNSCNNLLITREILKKNLYNKICFIGLTATGTTDIGSTPFDKDFENVGTHPAVFNTILQNQFIRIAPIWIILLVTFLIIALTIFIIENQKSIITSTYGIIFIIIVILITGIFFRITDIYISPVIPLFYSVFSFVAMIIVKFLLSEKDKSIIRNTFNRYLSPEVINELLKSPDKIELGGEKIFATAMFTDIEGFSSISEKFMEDPKTLVNLLNEYLSAMTDIIIENGGIIDKYEGDAIIAIFGPPLNLKDHAYRACISAIRMKEKEIEINQKIKDQNIVDKPFYTRIGLNSGDMVVGNMGSTKRLDYTMIGHTVNLASRLEGVNKLYGTYKLISEYTYDIVKDRIFARRLDRVRVVNIKTPIRLYELINTIDRISPEEMEKFSIFDRGLTQFENFNYKEALGIFKEIKDLDKTTEIYIERCNKFIETPPPDNWDGVYNLTTK